MRVFEITGRTQAQISNWIQEDKTMTETQEMNAAEEYAEYQETLAWERAQERADYFRRKNRGEDI